VEYRPISEVERADSLATLTDAPVTNLHHGLINASNWRRAAVGSLSGVARMDGDKVVADLVVQDKHTIGLIDSGERREISCGYQCRLERTPGTFEGERYDAIQRDIKYNHVALVPRGRAGREVALRLDAQDNQIDGLQDTMKIEIISGIEHEVGSAAHRAALTARADSERETQLRLDALPGLEGAKATLTAQLQEANARLDAMPGKIAEAVQARIALLAIGKRAGVDIREDMSDDEARRAVIGKLHPSMDLEGKAEAYIEAAFDVAIASLSGKSSAASVREDAHHARRGEGEREDADDGLAPDERARRNMVKRAQRSASARTPGAVDKS